MPSLSSRTGTGSSTCGSGGGTGSSLSIHAVQACHALPVVPL
jgi:hypothetical protein